MKAKHISAIVDAALMVPRGWTVLEAEEHRLSVVLTELMDELQFAEEEEPVRYIVHEDGLDVVDALTAGPPRGTAVLVIGREALAACARYLDDARGRLVAGPRVIVMTTAGGAAGMAQAAPNLWSWVGNRHWDTLLSTPLIDADSRLESMRKATGLSDDEVRFRRLSGTLPADPLFAEWVSLLPLQESEDGK